VMSCSELPRAARVDGRAAAKQISPVALEQIK
jgi:hypothetical protein